MNDSVNKKIDSIINFKQELKKFKAWISGRKSYHNGERRNLKPTEILNRKIVVNPLANIKKDFVDSYFEKEILIGTLYMKKDIYRLVVFIAHKKQ